MKLFFVGAAKHISWLVVCCAIAKGMFYSDAQQVTSFSATLKRDQKSDHVVSMTMNAFIIRQNFVLQFILTIFITHYVVNRYSKEGNYN